MTVPVALTIAGSDSGAGAGIQADLKTFAAFDVYGLSVITAITAQNTVGVRAVQEVEVPLIRQQLDAVAEDFPITALKTGMLSSAAIIEAIADGIRRHELRHLVVDPVMVAKSGDRLLQEDAVEALRRVLLPLAEVVTPNLPEAETLAGLEIRSTADRIAAARAILALGARAVVVKGGHGSEDPVVDLLVTASGSEEFSAPRVATTSTHGTGCTYSAAIAAGLARGLGLRAAVSEARAYLSQALTTAPSLGHGHGPLNHFPAGQQSGRTKPPFAERDLEYLDGVHPPLGPVLREMLEQGRAENIPIVNPAVGRLLRVLVTALRPLRVVEVGTAIGFSTLWIASALQPDARVETIDPDRARTDRARRFWLRAGVSDRIRVINEPALRVLPRLSSGIQFAFIDALKQEYLGYLDALIPRMAPGGMMAVDNLLWSGRIAAGGRDADTQALREFNERFLGHDRLDATILPVGDGVGLGVVRPVP